jgi:hypothetical protein
MNKMFALPCLFLGSLFSLPVAATDFSELFDRAIDAVVTITITQNAEQLSGAEDRYLGRAGVWCTGEGD